MSDDFSSILIQYVSQARVKIIGGHVFLWSVHFVGVGLGQI